MRALIKTNKQISVDQIIQKVLIRNNNKHYDYVPKKQHQLTPPQNIWHFQLQQENLQLHKKMQRLTKQFTRKYHQFSQQHALHQQIAALQLQLQKVSSHNQSLQTQINKIRIKNSVIDENLRSYCDHSVKKGNKLNRSGLRDSKKDIIKNILQVSKLDNAAPKADSPQKHILKRQQTISINCRIEDSRMEVQINLKISNLSRLKKIIDNQQRLIKQYEQQINAGKRHRTTASTTNLVSNTHRLSHTSFKPLFSPGTIVKMKKH